MPNDKNSENTKPASNITDEPLVSAQVVADNLGVSSRFVLKLAASGDIPCVRLGQKCVRFSLSDVLSAIHQGR